MQNENWQNSQYRISPDTGTAKAGSHEASPAGPGPYTPEDVIRVKEWALQASADAQRAREIAEQTREEFRQDIKDIHWVLDSNDRKRSRNGWAAVVLALALVGACAYGYSRLAGDESLLAQFPAVQSALNALGQRIMALEAKIQSSAANWDGLNSRVAKVEQGAGANLRMAKDYAAEQSARVQHEMQAELNNRTQYTDGAISKLEAANAEDQKEIAQLRQELASAQSNTSEQLARTRQETGREMGNLRSDITRNRDDFDVVAKSLAKRRVDFEIAREQTREVMPGITLTLSKTDVGYQRVEGRLHVISDGRILWIRGQGIEEPLRFYSHQDERPYELIFTRISKDGAVGYVFVPGVSTAMSQITGDSGAVAANAVPEIEPAAQ